MHGLFPLALAYANARISNIPVSPNEGSAPDGGKDTPFDCSEFIQQRIPTREELWKWFASGGESSPKTLNLEK